MIGLIAKVGVASAIVALGVVGYSHNYARAHGGRMPPALYDAIFALPDSVSAALLSLAPTVRAEYGLEGIARASDLAMGGIRPPPVRK